MYPDSPGSPDSRDCRRLLHGTTADDPFLTSVWLGSCLKSNSRLLISRISMQILEPYEGSTTSVTSIVSRALKGFVGGKITSKQNFCSNAPFIWRKCPIQWDGLAGFIQRQSSLNFLIHLVPHPSDNIIGPL